MEYFLYEIIFFRSGIEAGIKLKTVMAYIPLNDCIEYVNLCTTD